MADYTVNHTITSLTSEAVLTHTTMNGMDFDLKSYADPNASTYDTGEKALWQSVIMQAVIDSFSGSKRTAERIEKQRAIAWFSLQNRDFMLVCSMAGLEPSCVLRGVRLALRKAAIPRTILELQKSVSTHSKRKTPAQSAPSSSQHTQRCCVVG